MTPDHAHKKHENDAPGHADGDDIRRPYDTSELDKVPHPTDEDPPYRTWWVM